MDTDNSDSSEDLFDIVTENFEINAFNYTDPSSFSGIVKWIIVDDLPGIIDLIKKGRSPNNNDNLGNTPLHVAVYLNRLSVIDYLLSLEDIYIDAQNFQGETPLLYAVRYERVEALKKLLAAKADARKPTNADVSPLHIAATREDHTLALLLLQYGEVDIDAQDYSGDTPLNEAVKDGLHETVAMFLYYNADATIACSNNLSPFMNAIIKDDIFLQELLIEYETDFNRETEEGMTVLFLAATQGTRITKEIIQRGADVNYHNVRNVLELCVDLDIFDLFTFVWDKVDYVTVWKKDIPSILKQVASEGKFNFVNCIIYSNQLRAVIDSSTDAGIIADFFKGVGLSYSNVRAIKASYILLAAGYDPDELDLEYVFSVLEYSPLYKVLLHMDVKYDEVISERKVHCLLSAILVCVSEPICATVDRFLQTPNRDEDNKLLNLHFIKPFVKHITLYKDLFMHTYFPNIQVNLMDKFTCEIPSLLELARNQFRLTVCSKYRIKKCSQFYTLINYMEIPIAIKRIINFEVPIY